MQQAVVAEKLAMVEGEDHNGLVGDSHRVELRQHPPELMVDLRLHAPRQCDGSREACLRDRVRYRSSSEVGSLAPLSSRAKAPPWTSAPGASGSSGAVAMIVSAQLSALSSGR